MKLGRPAKTSEAKKAMNVLTTFSRIDKIDELVEASTEHDSRAQLIGYWIDLFHAVSKELEKDNAPS